MTNVVAGLVHRVVAVVVVEIVGRVVGALDVELLLVKRLVALK